MSNSLSNSLFYRFKYQHHSIDELIDGLNQEQLDLRLNNKWSIGNHVAHLGRYQEVFSVRLDLMLDTVSPVFERYKAEYDDDFSKWLEKSILEARTDLKCQREELINQLDECEPEQLSRKGQHPVLGWLSITDWLQFFLLHESHHLYTIFWLRNQMLS